MALTRAQLLAGNDTQGTVLSGQVQAVTAGPGITISSTGVLSINSADPAFSAFVRTNAVGAFNGYIWPGSTGTAGQQLTLGAGNTLVWADSDSIPWTTKGQLIVGTGVGTDILLNAGANGTVLRANSATASGLEWVLSPPAVIVSGTAPASPEEGQLWYDCNTGYLKVYQSCVAPAGWTNVPEPGLPVDPAATSAAPAFVSGTGVTADPYICNATTAFVGSSVFVVNTVTVTGLAPNQFVPIVDLDAVLNGGRFSFSNNYADAGGTLVFQTIFTDLPASAPLTTYTAKIRVGYASSYINATVNIIEVLSVTSGSISGNPNDGATLTYTPGVASGGVAPTTTTWVWKRQSDGAQVTGTNPDDLTITIPANCVGDRIYVQITATDSLTPTPQTATADTAFLPSPPAVIGPSFSITSAGSIAGTAQVGQTLTYTQGTYTGGTAPVVESWVWYRESDNSAVTGTSPNNLTITIPADCSGDRVYVKYTVTDSSAPPIVLNQDTAFFPASPSVITGGVFPGLTFDPSTGPTASPASVNANGLKGTATATWPATPATTSLTSTGDLLFTVNNVGVPGQGPTSVSTGNTVELTWDPTAIAAAADNATLTGTLTDGVYTNTFTFTVDRSPNSLGFVDVTDKGNNAAVQSNTVTPTGFSVPVTLTVAGTASDPLTSPGISINSGAFSAVLSQTIIPGDTIRLQGTTGAGFSTPYGLDVSLGSGAPATDTWTATTAANTPKVDQPTITAPVSGATGINPATNTPPATVTVTGSAYNPLNGALGQQSADWEVYKGSYPLTSTNAITAVTQNAAGAWTGQTSGTSSVLSFVTYGQGKYVAILRAGQNYLTSSNGTSWTTVTGPFSASEFKAQVNYINGLFVITGGVSSSTNSSSRVWTSPDGVNWTLSYTNTGSNATTRTLNGIAYGNGTWCSVAGEGYVVTSPDTVTWTVRTTGVSGSSSMIACGFGNGLFVIGGGSGVIRTSPDGITWTARTSGTTSGPRFAAYDNGTWVVVCTGGKILTSPDAITWTSRVSGSTAQLNKAIFVGGTWYVFGDGGTVLASADNGVTWSPQVSGITTPLNGGIAGPDKIVSVGDSGKILTSSTPTTTLTIAGCQTDGFLTGDIVQAVPTTANAGPATISTLNDSSVTVYPAGTGWAIGQTITRTQSQTLLSTNAITAVGSIPSWVARVSGAAATTFFQRVAYGSFGGGVLITADRGAAGTGLRSTDNGVTWTSVPSLIWGGSRRVRGLATDNAGNWLISTASDGGTGTSLKSLDNGVTWVASGTSVPASYDATCASYIGSKWTLWGSDGTGTSTRRISTDGMATWTTASGVFLVTSHNYVSAWSLYVVTTNQTSGGVGTPGVRTSPDDITYTIRYTFPGTGQVILGGFAYGNGVGVAVGTGGTIVYSTDGITWTVATSGTTQSLQSITYSNNQFTACGDGGTVITSLDGINWVPVATGTSELLYGIAATPTKLVTVGDGNTILTSNSSQSLLKIAGALNDGFASGNTVTSDPAAAGPADITSLSNIYATLNPYSASWTTGQKLKRTTDQYLQIVPPPANPNTTNLTSINIPQASLLPSTKYWSRVRYTSSNPVTSLWSPWSSFTTASSFVPAIGAPLAGGFYAGQIKVFAGEEGGGLPVVDTVYNLIVAPRVSGSLQGAFGGATDSTVAYKTASTADSPATVADNAVFGGTATALFGDAAHPAFNWAKNTATGPNAGTYDPTNSSGTGIGGKNDWYIPAENELQILYRNLKPTTTSNVTTTGINPNAVPPTTTNYTTTNPAQTTVVAFQTGGTEAMGSASPTLSSTQVAATPANRVSITFTNGTRTSAAKLTVGFARAIRREEV